MSFTVVKQHPLQSLQMLQKLYRHKVFGPIMLAKLSFFRIHLRNTTGPSPTAAPLNHYPKAIYTPEIFPNSPGDQ